MSRAVLPKNEVRLLRGAEPTGAVAPARNHVGFAVEKDGTPLKAYVDLEGSVTGVSFVHVSVPGYDLCMRVGGGL